MNIHAGTKLGSYEIVSRIGAGGMGEVWRARDSRIGRDVAVKVLPESFSADAERVRRFEQEARAAGTLNHPGLVTIFDVGTQEGAPYIVMELLEGETLRDLLGEEKTTALSLRKAIDYATQIALALAVAHEKGIIHRDLKPENLFVTSDGRVKILDFGLAKLVSESMDAADDRTAQRQTSPGTVMGTAGYMSPEQVRAQEIDHRSDIFSFGAILFEMLSGQRAFKRDSSVETMNAILKEDPPELSSVNQKLPPALDQIVRHCLEKNPRERFQSARDLAFDLTTLSGLSGSASARAIAGARRGRRVLMLVGLLAGLLLAGGAGYLIGKTRRGPESTGALKLTPLTYEGGVEEQPAFAPDGNSFLYVSARSGNLDIYLRRIGGENAINLTQDSPDDDYDPAFSPDGKQIVFRSDRTGGGIFLMGATGESVRRLTDAGFRPAWSPDGKEIAFQSVKVLDPTTRPRESELWRINVVSGERKRIEAGPDAVDPRWSPDGSRIAFWGLPAGSGKRVIYTVAASGGTPVPLTDDAHFNWHPVWSANGEFLYFSTNRNGTTNLWRIAIDPRSGKAKGEPVPVTSSAHSSSSVTIAPDGKRLLFVAGFSSMFIEKVDLKAAASGGKPSTETLLRDARHLHYLAVSPDNQWLVFRAGLAPEDLFIVKTDGTALRRLTNDPSKNRVPNWSGDGKVIYFMADQTGRYEIWRIRVDGSGLEQVTSTRGGAVGDPRVSPDGKKLTVLVYGQREGRRGALVDLQLPLEKRKVDLLPLIDGLAFAPEAWSPDSSRLAGSVSGPDGRQVAIAIRGTDGRYQRLENLSNRSITVTGAGLRWSSDGAGLYFVNGSKLMYMDINKMQHREVLALPPNSVSQVAVSDDGSSLYLLRRDSESDIWMAELEHP